MSSDPVARGLGLCALLALGVLLSRTSNPSTGALGRAGFDQGAEASNGRKLLESLVGEEWAANPEEFRRRLQQTFQYSYCFSLGSAGGESYLQMDCPFLIRVSKSATDGSALTLSNPNFMQFGIMRTWNNQPAVQFAVKYNNEAVLGPFEVNALNGLGLNKVASLNSVGSLNLFGIQASSSINAQSLFVNQRVQAKEIAVKDSQYERIVLTGDTGIVTTYNGGFVADTGSIKVKFFDNVSGNSVTAFEAKTTGAVEALGAIKAPAASFGQLSIFNQNGTTAAISQEGVIEGTSLISRVGNEVYGGFMPMGAMIARTARVINITAQGDITAFSLSAQGGITTQGGVSAQGDISGRIVYAQSVSAQNSVSGKTVAADTVSTNNVNAQGTVTGNAVTAQTVTALKGITTQATVTAQAVAAQTLTAAQGITTQGSVAAKGLAVNGNAAVTGTLATNGLTVSGSTKFGDVAAANLAVGKSLTVAGTTQFGDLAAANLAVGKSLTVAGATQFGDLAAANLAVSKGLTVAGSTQLENTAVRGEIQTRTMIASSNVAVRGDFWVSKDFTTAGKVIARSGLVAKTCSCSNRY